MPILRCVVPWAIVLTDAALHGPAGRAAIPRATAGIVIIVPVVVRTADAWGQPIRVDGFTPDGRWFGAPPETILRVDGEDAERLIPKIRSVIESYKFGAYGDDHPWPGPNSNTFVQAALDAVPELNAVLPPTAIGKDYPYRGEWYGLTPSRTLEFSSIWRAIWE